MAAGNILAGFVKGASGRALDDIDRRRATEAESKKLEMLERLRRETAREMAQFEETLRNKRTDKDLSSPDFDRGKMTLRDAEGNIKSERDLTQSEIEQHRTGREKDQLSLDNIRSQMSSRQRGDERQDRLASAQIGSYNRSGRGKGLDGSSKGPGGKDILMTEYNNTFRELKDAGAPPSALANFQTAWYEGVNFGEWGPDSQRKFLNEMRKSFTRGRKSKDGQQFSPLLESFGTADALLDSKLGE
jgi:hypothetical protein